MTIYRFGRCQIDADERVLTMSGIPLKVEPRVFDLILFLIESSPNLQTKEALIKAVWDGRIVTDSAISVAVNAARKAIGDSGRSQVYIKTVAKHGFRFLADVKKYEIPVSKSTGKAKQAANVKEAGTSDSVQELIPTIAIVPGIISVINEDDLAIAYIDDIATELSRFHLLRVLSPGTTFEAAFRKLDIETMFQQYGVNYLVSVSFAVRANQCSLKITITDTDHCVVDSMEERVMKTDLLKLRDYCVSMVVSSISAVITEHEIQTCRSGSNILPDAYSCLLHGLAMYKLGEVSPERSRQALQWFEQVLELDPSCARAHAWRECCGADFEPDATHPDYIKRTRNRLEHALELDPGDHEVHRMCGGLYCIVGEHELSEYHLSKAAEINPNDSRILLRTGFYRSFLSHQSNDLVYIDRAFDLHPKRPGYYYFDRGVAAFNNELYEKALGDLRISGVDTVASQLYTVACLEGLHRKVEVAGVVEDIKKSYPEISSSGIANQYPFVCYGQSNRGKSLFSLLNQAGVLDSEM